MRLIDADELSFRCAYEGDCMASDEKCKKCSYYVCSYEEIQEQPTAYDVDKVEAELEEKQNDINGNTSLHYFYSEGYSDAIDYLIDIVRKGGVE